MAVAAATAVLDKQRADARQAQIDSLDIRDPGQVRRTPPPSQEPTPSPVAAPSIPGATADGGYTEELLDRAHAAGIPEHEARQYPAPLLEKAVSQIEQAYSQFEPEPQFPQQQFQQQFQQPQQQQQNQLLMPAALPPPKDESIVWDDALVEAWQHNQNVLQQQMQINAALYQEQQQMRQQLEQLVGGSHEQQNREDRQTMDRLFSADKEYADVIGQGQFHDVQGTRFQSVRQQVGIRMETILAEDEAYGRQRPIDAVYKEAMQSLFGSRAAQQQINQLGERLRNRAGQFVARPTQTTRSNELPPGVERAEAAVEKLLNEQRANGRR